MDWEPERWLREFGRASASGQGFRELRAEVFESTVAIVRGREYACGGRTVRLDDDDEYLILRESADIDPRRVHRVAHPALDELGQLRFNPFDRPGIRRHRNDARADVVANPRLNGV